SRRTRRRKLVNVLMQALATLAALAAVAVLALVIISVAQRGASALSFDFFTKTAATFGQGGGGVANALVGSFVIVALARAAGETAPLLFTTSIAANAVTWDPRQPVLSIPYDIFVLSESADPADHARAWALGFVLICFVLVTSLTARLLLARYRKRLES